MAAASVAWPLPTLLLDHRRRPVLFPQIRFAIFFAIVMPACWLLMPLPGRGRRAWEDDDRHPWVVPFGLLVAAAVLGPLVHQLEGTPLSFLVDPPSLIRLVEWMVAIALAYRAVRDWLVLGALTRWNVFMLVASYVFYGSYRWRFVVLLIVSTVVNQVFAQAISTRAGRSRRLVLVLAVAFNLGVLGWYKYRGFLAENGGGLFEAFGLHLDPPGGELILPIGISFFTFQALSYVIDVYRDKLRPVPLLEFAVYLAFFPHVVAGPIVRAAEFLPQLRRPRDARAVDTGLAFWLIAVGLFKKVVVSSYLASTIVDPVFKIPSQHQAVDTLLGIYGYAIQIYCDFSGYTDMAIGLALLLGFRFPQNFDAPYTAVTLQDFWRRWHMTLSRWLRDYLYIPLGGNQGSAIWGLCTLFLTMLLGGFWHGAAWNFVIWGALHGAWLAGERVWQDRAALMGSHRSPAAVRAEVAAHAEHHPGADHHLSMGDAAHEIDLEPVDDTVLAELDAIEEAAATAAPRPRLSPTARRWLGRILTFHVVCLGWVFFRSPTVGDAGKVLGRLFSFGTGQGVNLVVVATIALLLASQFVPSGTVGRLQATFSRLQVWQQGVVLAVWITFTSALSPTGVAPFIYFSF
jgi:D-alanyl-lipoteichoic acid acyltransferase DltB (MBOAT superfamily)